MKNFFHKFSFLLISEEKTFYQRNSERLCVYLKIVFRKFDLFCLIFPNFEQIF